MEYFLLALSVVLGSARNVFTKKVNAKNQLKNPTAISGFTFAFSFLTILMIGIFDVKTTLIVPWWLVIAYAVFTLANQILIAKAVDCGSISLTSLFASCGFIIPTLFGCIYYKEQLNVLHIIGIVLIVLSFSCSVKKENDNNFNFVWLLCAIGGLITAGALGVVQKIFTSDYTGYKLNNFMTMSFALILGANLIAWLITSLAKSKKSVPQNERLSKKQIFLQIVHIGVLGVSLGAIHSINTNLSGLLPSSVAFPVINGGVILVTTIMSKFFFNEKLSLTQKIGLIIGVLSIICITIADSVI